MVRYDGEFPAQIKVGHTASSCKINVPIRLARMIGLDKAKQVLIVKSGPKHLEVKVYEGQEDYKEYIS